MQSVAEQDYPRVEHLIVDGCSKDNTLSIVQRFVERNTTLEMPHSIRLICDHDEGLYDAMNKAITMAQGNYIVFLNAGDKLHEKTTLSSIVKQIEWIRWNHANPAIIYGETDLVDDNGNFIRHRRLTAPEKLTSKSFLSGMRVCHQSFYVSTELAREVPYNLKYRYSADFDWCIRLMKLAEKRRMRIHNTHLILTDYLATLEPVPHRADLRTALTALMGEPDEAFFSRLFRDGFGTVEGVICEKPPVTVRTFRFWTSSRTGKRGPGALRF